MTEDLDCLLAFEVVERRIVRVADLYTPSSGFRLDVCNLLLSLHVLFVAALVDMMFQRSCRMHHAIAVRTKHKLVLVSAEHASKEVDDDFSAPR